MLAVLVVLAFVILIASIGFFNPIRRSVYGIIGIGGSYIVFAGLAMLIFTIGAFIKGGFEFNMEVIFTIVFTLACVAYLVYVMIARCETIGQRIWLPFAAILIAFGAFYRFLGALFLHIPMGDPTPAGADEDDTTASVNGFSFPEYMYSQAAQETYRHEGNGSYICPKTGHRVQFRDSDFVSGTPSGWDVY